MYPEKAKKALKYALDVKKHAQEKHEAIKEEICTKAEELAALKAKMDSVISPADLSDITIQILATENTVKKLSERWLLGAESMIEDDEKAKASQQYQAAREEFKISYAEAVAGFERAEREMQEYSRKARALTASLSAFTRVLSSSVPGAVSEFDGIIFPENLKVEEFANIEAVKKINDMHYFPSPKTNEEIIKCVFRGV